MDPRRPPLHNRLRPRHWIVIDCAVTVVLALAYTVIWPDLATIDGPRWVAALVVAACVLPTAVRRRWPRAALTLVVLGQAVATALGANHQPALAVAFVIYLIPLRLPRAAALGWLAGTVVTLATGVLALDSRTHITAVVGNATAVLLVSTLVITISWMIGYSVHQQRVYAAGRRVQAQRQAREEIAEARRAVSEQRLTIARELHDVVAHSMSLIAVQAGVANYVINDNPAEASRALTSIEQISRDALHEMRALLGILRTDSAARSATGPDGDLVPEPGLADLDTLIARSTATGLRIDLDVRGQRPSLAAGIDLAAYRVIQEAVTNVIKHAAADRCQVIVAYQADAVSLEITDDGATRPAGTDTAAAGHGLVGMRERVSMYGGQFDAAPLASGGFRVTARFPLDARAA